MSPLARVLEAILEVLDLMEIRYAIGGSLASSLYGLRRSTMDVDIVANLTAEDVPGFVGLAKTAFYVDENEALRAVTRGSSFNLIHFDSLYKVDIFPVAGDCFRQTELHRRIFSEVPVDGRAVECAFISIEDTILAKLHWFQMGQSGRQWEDLLGMLAVSGKNLDRAYLDEWAQKLNVTDLLDRLIS